MPNLGSVGVNGGPDAVKGFHHGLASSEGYWSGDKPGGEKQAFGKVIPDSRNLGQALPRSLRLMAFDHNRSAVGEFKACEQPMLD